MAGRYMAMTFRSNLLTGKLTKLFSNSLPPSEHLRQTTILSAVYHAALDHQQKGNAHLELTDQSNGVSIDEVIKHINVAVGLPDRPVERPFFSIVETLFTLNTLVHKGFLDTSGPEYEVITLTEYLFESLGEEVAAS